MITVCAFHTDDAVYTEAASRLRASLDKLQLPYYIKNIGRFDRWDIAAAQKATFVQEALLQIKDNILYTDADSIVNKRPDLLDSFQEDIGVVVKGGKEILSGSVFFSYNQRTLDFVSQWRTACLKPSRWYGDMPSFQKLIKQCLTTKTPCSAGILPETYCKIFDLMRNVGDGVITHYQASRIDKGKNTEAQFLARMPHA